MFTTAVILLDYNGTHIQKDENSSLYLAASVGSVTLLLFCVVFITIIVSVILIKRNFKVNRESIQAREIHQTTVEYEEVGLNQQDSRIFHTEDNVAYSCVSMNIN